VRWSCLCVVLLPQLLALSSRTPALGAQSTVARDSMFLSSRAPCLAVRRLPRLRGGQGSESADDGGGKAEGGADVAEGALAEEMSKTSELLAKVTTELGETEELMNEKKEIDQTCDELLEAKKKAKENLAKQTAALLLAAAKEGDAQSVKEALDNGADFHVMDEDGDNERETCTCTH
jgi:hypothetical protein